MSAFLRHPAQATARAAARVGGRGAVGCCASLIALLGASMFAAGCAGDSIVGTQASAGSAGSAGSDPFLNLGGDPGDASVPSMGGSIVGVLPPDFTEADAGGYKLGSPIDESSSGAAGGPGDDETAGDTCGNILLGEVRDFKGANEAGGHPDFEVFTSTAATPHLVADSLGMDKKPVYASKCEQGATLDKAACPYGEETTSQANFDEWYHNTPGVNLPYIAYFYFQPQSDGLFLFASTSFFPLDNAGFGNTPGQAHNCLFTTELHTKFKYVGGETFQFTGDDDVWVFINNKLAVDLGGVHVRQASQIKLDDSAAALGIAPGTVYPLDLFQADRHTAFSSFRILTNLAFVNCGYVPPDVVK